MNLAAAIQSAGTSEGLKKAWDTRGRGRAEKPVTERPANWKSLTAKSSYVRADVTTLVPAKANERLVAQIFKGESYKDSESFDVKIKNVAIELKTKFPASKNERVNMPGSARERKGAMIVKDKIKAVYTVAFDSSKYGVKPVTIDALKSGEVKILIKSGVGAYAYDNMHEASFDEFKSIINDKKWVFPGTGRGKDTFGSFNKYIRERGWEM